MCACEGYEQRTEPTGVAPGDNEYDNALGFQQKHFRGVAADVSP